MKVCTLSCLLMLAAAQDAVAHHSTPTVLREDTATSESQNEVRLRLSSVAFEQETTEGQLWSATLSTQFSLGAGFALRLQMPLLRFDDGNGANIGVGDVGGGFLYRRSLGYYRLSVGGGLLAPTGNADKGLGRGTLATEWFAYGSRSLSESWSVMTSFNTVTRIGDADGSTHAFVDAQNSAELRASAGGAWHGDHKQASLSMIGTLPLANGGQRYFSLASSVAHQVANAWLFAYVEVPVGPRQLDWRASLSVAYPW